MKTPQLCALAMDDNEVKRQQQFYLEQIDKKSKIYMSLMEYYELLKCQLELEQDSYRRWPIEREMKKIRKEFKKYYDPGILAMCKFERHEDVDDKKTTNGRIVKFKK